MAPDQDPGQSHSEARIPSTVLMVGNNSSGSNSMNTSFFVAWGGMSQVWRKHSWEEPCSVWGIWKNFTQDWLGRATEMELKLVQVTGKLTACEGGVNSQFADGQACSETSDTAGTRDSVTVRTLCLLLSFSLSTASCFFTTDHILCMVGNTDNLQLPLSSADLGLLSQLSFEKPWHGGVRGQMLTDLSWARCPTLDQSPVARRWDHIRTWQLLLDLNGPRGEGEDLGSRQGCWSHRCPDNLEG